MCITDKYALSSRNGICREYALFWSRFYSDFTQINEIWLRLYSDIWAKKWRLGLCFKLNLVVLFLICTCFISVDDFSLFTTYCSFQAKCADHLWWIKRKENVAMGRFLRLAILGASRGLYSSENEQWIETLCSCVWDSKDFIILGASRGIYTLM